MPLWDLNDQAVARIVNDDLAAEAARGAAIACHSLEHLILHLADRPHPLGKRPFHAWVRLPAPWVLVTDNHADPEQVELFRQSGVTVQLVDVAPAQAA